MARLNPAQEAAVLHQNGPLLVLAGAGSGKTRVITHRIVNLLEKGVPPQAILALTFTNKAAEEMLERVSALLRSRGTTRTKDLTICTFHAFGLQVLTRERKTLGGVFTIFDQGDTFGVIKEILRELRADRRFDIAAIAARISNAKNAFLSPEELPDSGEDPYEEITRLVFPKYTAALRRFSAYDFDDLVCAVVRTWSERPDILARWQKRFRYILVDEYQDTNRAQLKLLSFLASPHENICVVGDDDQAIYAWRGADVRNILEFEDQFKGTTVVKLEQNYRSTKAVLDVANAVIAKRPDVRHRKILFSERTSGEKVKVVTAASPESEALFVAREVRRLRENSHRTSEMAVLYRSNAQAKLIEETFRGEGIAYRMIGGQQFFDRKEVKDVLAYMKLALNRLDEISLRRILNYPARGIGDTTVDRLHLQAQARGWTLWQAIERADAIDEITSGARAGCRELERIIGDLRRQLLVEHASAEQAARRLCSSIRLKEDLQAASPSLSAAEKRWENVEALFRTLARRDGAPKEATKNEEAALAAFLHALTIKFEDVEEEKGEQVTLSTLHGAKGLEFQIVFLIGCEEGLLPHSRTLDSKITEAAPQDIEEERRLFYVGVTRAKERLFLCRCAARPVRAKPVARTPSRFLGDIPDDLYECIEAQDLDTRSMQEMAVNASALLTMLDGIGS